MVGKQKYSIENDKDLEYQWIVNHNLVTNCWYPKRTNRKGSEILWYMKPQDNRWIG